MVSGVAGTGGGDKVELPRTERGVAHEVDGPDGSINDCSAGLIPSGWRSGVYKWRSFSFSTKNEDKIRTKG